MMSQNRKLQFLKNGLSALSGGGQSGRDSFESGQTLTCSLKLTALTKEAPFSSSVRELAAINNSLVECDAQTNANGLLLLISPH